MGHRNTEFYKSFAPEKDTVSRYTNPSATMDRPIERGSPILTGVKNGLTLRVDHAIDTPLGLLRNHQHLLTETRLIYPAALRSVSFEELRKDDFLITSISANSELVARAHAARVQTDEENSLKLSGFASRENISGTAQIMIAATIVAQEHDSGATPSGQAIARHYKSGEINQSSTIPFSRMGFYGARTTLEPVSFEDIHMYDEWTFIEGQPHVGCHLMRGKSKDIGPRAWDVLSDWKLTFGKSRIEEANTLFFGKEWDDE